MEEIFLRNARSSPVIAAPIKVTVTIPITIPSVVRIDRILLARIAPQEMPTPSLNSVSRFISTTTAPKRLQPTPGYHVRLLACPAPFHHWQSGRPEFE